MSIHIPIASRQEDITLSSPRRIYNPIQKDYATFLETSAATNGERTLIEIDLAPGGSNGLHYHKTFLERFEVLEGDLHVQVGKQIHILKPSQSVTASVNMLHRFFNPTDRRTRFLMELRPGSTNFEQFLQIAYGLVADGKTNKYIPTNFYRMAVLMMLSDSTVPGVFAMLKPLFRYLAAQGRKKGIEQELIRTYCQ